MRFAKWGTLMLCVIFVLVFGQGCKLMWLKTYDDIQKKTAEYVEANRRQANLITNYLNEIGDLTTERDGLNGDLSKQTELVAAQQKMLQSIDDAYRRLKEHLAALEKERTVVRDTFERVPGWEMEDAPGGIKLIGQGDVFFSSGKAEIKPEGQTLLKNLVSTLKRTGNEIRISGHTDSVPITVSGWGYISSGPTASSMMYSQPGSPPLCLRGPSPC